jgi:polyhydroxybutyrate depolymerase
MPATPRQWFRRAAGTLFVLALCAAPGLAAMPKGMAMDVLDSLTKPPSSRPEATGTDFSKTGAGKTGPAGPTAPTAPVVPGAAPQAVEPLPLRQEGRFAPRQETPTSQPRQTGQTGQAGQAGQGRQQVLTLTHDGAERRALVTLPKAQPQQKGGAATRYPVIIFLHGAGGSAPQAMRQTALAARAAAAGFIAVFPDGLGPEGGQTWNAWNCCGFARDSRVDDVGFLSVLTARLRTDFHADPARIHLAGFSNGAMLASRFVLERPGVAASLISVAGYLPCDAPKPPENLPVLLIHGDQDQVARFAPTRAHPATGRFCEDHPARAQAEFWVRGMGLPSAPKVRETAAARQEFFTPKQNNARGLLRFVIVKGGGHAWPGGPRERYRYCDLPTAGVDATGLVLEFCKHPLGQERTGASAPAKGTVRKAR